jgi:hypothetical protein
LRFTYASVPDELALVRDRHERLLLVLLFQLQYYFRLAFFFVDNGECWRRHPDELWVALT